MSQPLSAMHFLLLTESKNLYFTYTVQADDHDSDGLSTGACARGFDFGDDSEDASLGALAGSRTVAHVYATRGSYIVTATVTDDTGRQSEASIGLTVAAASTSMQSLGSREAGAHKGRPYANLRNAGYANIRNPGAHKGRPYANLRNPGGPVARPAAWTASGTDRCAAIAWAARN